MGECEPGDTQPEHTNSCVDLARHVFDLSFPFERALDKFPGTENAHLMQPDQLIRLEILEAVALSRADEIGCNAVDAELDGLLDREVQEAERLDLTYGVGGHAMNSECNQLFGSYIAPADLLPRVDSYRRQCRSLCPSSTKESPRANDRVPLHAGWR